MQKGTQIINVSLDKFSQLKHIHVINTQIKTVKTFTSTPETWLSYGPFESSGLFAY